MGFQLVSLSLRLKAMVFNYWYVFLFNFYAPRVRFQEITCLEYSFRTMDTIFITPLENVQCSFYAWTVLREDIQKLFDLIEIFDRCF